MPVSVPFTREAMPMPGSAMARADRAWTAPTELFEPGVTQMYHLLTQLASGFSFVQYIVCHARCVLI